MAATRHARGKRPPRARGKKPPRAILAARASAMLAARAASLLPAREYAMLTARAASCSSPALPPLLTARAGHGFVVCVPWCGCVIFLRCGVVVWLYE